MIFADVIVDISVKSLDRTFQYRVPDSMQQEAVVGAQVLIPFGRGNRQLKGFIINLSGTPRYDVEKTKSIISVEKQGVVAESHLLSLAYWIKQRYGSTMNDAIKAVMPVRREIKEQVERRIYPCIAREEMLDFRELCVKKHYTARLRLVDALLQTEGAWEQGLDYEETVKKWNVSQTVIKTIMEQKIITVESKRQYRNPLRDTGEKTQAPVLNEEQEAVVKDFATDYRQGVRGNYLIHGVTGSGKTEIYMACIEQVLAEGQQVIVLIPEIALTFQTVKRFYGRFGEKVSILHSRLSAGERYDQYLRAKNGDIQIMIGPRSALFTPFSDLGLIVVDEEHEGSYQSDSVPKYHAREVAVKRGEMLNASVIFGSATPSLESYYQTQQGKWKLYTLKNRAGNARLPQVSVVDLREEFAAKNYSVFSRSLQEKIEDRLEKREQIMLFINRRGYAGFVSCRKCGQAIQCDNCSVSMKPHEYRGKVNVLKCHYCGAKKPMPSVCPSCGSKYIGTFGLGTQQVEEMVRKRFRGSRVLRMDADTTTGKEGHSRILKSFAQGEADILIGTQMIVKGHDFPNVTLVGVLAADLSLNSGDYRSAERTFQLLTQAAGRAGRGDKPGEVVFQTYQPEHYSIVNAAREDYVSFYCQELSVRQMLQYPPISHILEVLVSSETQQRAQTFSEIIREQLACYQEAVILGPVDAAVSKINNIYRKVIYIKATDVRMLSNIENRIEDFWMEREEWKDCSVAFALDYA